jgi:hypothetical protein
MQFSVTFVSEQGHWVIDGVRERGLRALDRARDRLGFPVKDVSYYPMDGKEKVNCLLMERIARRAYVVFENCNDAVVCVPRASLNQYVVFSYREGDGIGIQFMHVDEDRLVEDWIAAGAPLKWTPAGAEDNDNQ